LLTREGHRSTFIERRHRCTSVRPSWSGFRKAGRFFWTQMTSSRHSSTAISCLCTFCCLMAEGKLMWHQQDIQLHSLTQLFHN
jgi:hypothetical protein